MILRKSFICLPLEVATLRDGGVRACGNTVSLSRSASHVFAVVECGSMFLTYIYASLDYDDHCWLYIQ